MNRKLALAALLTVSPPPSAEATVLLQDGFEGARFNPFDRTLGMDGNTSFRVVDDAASPAIDPNFGISTTSASLSDQSDVNNPVVFQNFVASADRYVEVSSTFTWSPATSRAGIFSSATPRG